MNAPVNRYRFAFLGFLLVVVALAMIVPLPRVQGQQNVNFSIGGFVNNPDPCFSPYATRTSVPVNIGSATTTQLVGLVSGQKIYVCTGLFTMTGTTPAATLEYGTGTNCATGTTVLTGAMAPTSGSELFIGETGVTQLITPAGNALCLLSGGTTPSIQGYILVAQQ